MKNFKMVTLQAVNLEEQVSKLSSSLDASEISNGLQKSESNRPV